MKNLNKLMVDYLKYCEKIKKLDKKTIKAYRTLNKKRCFHKYC